MGNNLRGNVWLGETYNCHFGFCMQKKKVQLKGLRHLSAVALPSGTSLLACSWLHIKGQWKLIKRSHFLLPTLYSLWQLSLCELSIILAASSIPVEAKPAIIRLLCCRGQATHWMGYIHWRSPRQRGYLLSWMRGLAIIFKSLPQCLWWRKAWMCARACV